MTGYLVKRANFLVFGVLLVILALVGAMTLERLNASREAREWLQHSYRVLGATKDLAIALRDAERGQRGYVLTGKDDYLAPYDTARDRIGGLVGELQRLTADNVEQQGCHSAAFGAATAAVRPARRRPASSTGGSPTMS